MYMYLVTMLRVGIKRRSQITDYGSEIILISIKSGDWLFHH